jgi:hypothetical protein
MCFAVTPHEAWVSLPNCIVYSCPLARAAAHCAFQLSLLSTITPRNLAVSFDGMCWSPSTSWYGYAFLGVEGMCRCLPHNVE